MAGIRIILLPLGPASRTIFARLSTFRRHELSLLLFSFSLLAPGTHDTHCSCDDQRATISLSSSLTTTVISFLSRLLTRITAFSSSPSTFFLSFSLSLSLSFSLSLSGRNCWLKDSGSTALELGEIVLSLFIDLFVPVSLDVSKEISTAIRICLSSNR